MLMQGRARGYTLVELLVVMAVLGLLATMAMPLAEMTLQRERERELKRALWEIRDAIDAYKRARDLGAIAGPASGSPYPPDLPTLTRAVTDARVDHRGEVMRFLRSVPRDPFADPAVPAELGWVLRSFMSEAAEPKPGGDVYDVHSLSDRIGLNGIPLKQW
jgi:general secretion pathway protein G